MSDAPASTTPNSAPAAAPTPTPADAQAQIAALRRDPDFISKWAAKDANARQRMDELHRIAYPGETSLAPDTAAVAAPAAAAPTDREQAHARIAALKKDPAWVAKWANGDTGARAELDGLMKQAHPGDTAVSIDPTQPAPDPTAAEIDAAFPPAAAHQFEVPVIADEHGNTGPNEVAAAKFLGEVLSTARFPREIGNSLMREVARVEARTRNMTDEQVRSYVQEQREVLERLWGDQTDANISLAKRLVHELDEKHRGLKDVLDSLGAAQASASVIVAIHGQAKRLFDRNVKGK